MQPEINPNDVCPSPHELLMLIKQPTSWYSPLGRLVG